MNESNLPVPPVSAAPFAPAATASMTGFKTFGQVLDRTYRLTRSHFKLLVGMAAIPSGIVLLLVMSLEVVIWIPMLRQFPNPPSPEAMLQYLTPGVIVPVLIGFVLLNLAIFSIYLAAASHASVQADLGVEVTLREAYGMALQRGGRHLWLLLLMYLCTALPLLLIEAAGLLGISALVRSGGTPAPALFLLLPLVFLLYLGALVYAILMGLRLSLAFPACVAEGLTAIAAIKRSFQLSRGAMGRIFLVLLVVYAVVVAGFLVIEFVAIMVAVVAAIVAMVAHIHLAAPWSYIGLGLVGVCGFAALVLFTSLTYAATMAALAVLYNDQRLRKDGLPPAAPQAGEVV
jgi:hypothetical protein